MAAGRKVVSVGSLKTLSKRVPESHGCRKTLFTLLQLLGYLLCPQSPNMPLDCAVGFNMVLHPAVSSRTMKHHLTVGGEEHSGRARVAGFCLLKMPWAGGRGVKGMFALSSVWANSCSGKTQKHILYVSESSPKGQPTESVYH